MRRLLLCLPFCLLPVTCAPTCSTGVDPVHVEEPAPVAEVEDDGKALPKESAMTKLASTDPIAFLEACIRRYDREVKGYRCVLVRQERLKGKLKPTEETTCDFREQPFSVRMDWRKGAGEAQRILYVKDENDNKVLALGAGLRSLVGVVSRDLKDASVRDATRYPPSDFGIQIGMRRTLDAWLAARKRGDLEVKVVGEKRIKEVGDRLCWVVKRTGYKKAEDDGILESTFYFDKETWLQVGSVLKGAEGRLIASYYFRDIALNPTFPANTFTRDGLK